MKHTATLLLLFLFSASLMAQIPESFDLRDYNDNNYVTSVKSQIEGTCWTHGSMAAIEGNLLMTGVWANAGETGEPNLAEYHLDWWNGFNQHNNDDLTPTSGSGLEVHQGGDYRVTTAYLSRGEGAVRDIDGQSFETAPERTNATYHYYYPRTVEWFTLGSGLDGIDVIKQQIMDEGVMATCMCYAGSFINGNYCHYQPASSSEEPNHSIAIIGWDDNLQTQAPLPGAWLCKNSWGTWWANDGYFWISYYDKQACRNPEMGAISFTEVEPMQYEKVFYYDYHGWRDEQPEITTAANRFDIDGDYFMEAVSFFTNDNNINYEISVYESIDASGPEGLLSTVSGTIEHSGFHTIDLPAPLSLMGMDEVVVYLSLEGGSGIAYDRTSDVPVLLGGNQRTIVESVAAPNESFYFDINDETWKDFYDYDDPSGFQNSGNFCIKALAVSTAVGIEKKSSSLPMDINCYPNPVMQQTTIQIHSTIEGNAQLAIIDCFGRNVYTQSIDLSKGGNTIEWTKPSELTSGIYHVLLYNNNILSGKTKLLIK